jgi:hypothetical protein
MILRRLPIAILFQFLVAAALAPAAWAGRGIPDPVLSQFADGYGFVAADVIESEQTPLAEDWVGVKFKVVEVLADTVRLAPRLDLKPGDVIHMPLTFGYAAMLEHGPIDGPDGVLAPGIRYYLTIRRVGKLGFQHAWGADAARLAQTSLQMESARLRRLREVAALPRDRRLDEALRVAASARESHAVRDEVLNWLSRKSFGEYFRNSEREVISRAMHHLWDEADFLLSNDQVGWVDSILVWSDPVFAKSLGREKLWLRRIFAPFPANPEDVEFAVRQRWRTVYRLGDFLIVRPRETGLRIMAEIKDDRWPLEFRREVADRLLQAYGESKAPDPAWEPALQAFYGNALKDSNSVETRAIVMSIRWGANLEKGDGRRRAFVAGMHARWNLVQASKRMWELLARDPSDQQAAVAISEIKETIALLEQFPVPNVQ